MNGIISLDGLLDFINSLSLDSRNKRWLGEKLIEEACKEEAGLKYGAELGKKKGISSRLQKLQELLSILQILPISGAIDMFASEIFHHADACVR